MQSRFKRIRYYGTSLTYPGWQNRNVIIANNISLLSVSVLFFLNIVHSITHPGDKVVYASIIVGMILLSVPLLHRSGFLRLGRTLLTVALTTGMLILTLTRKITSEEVVSMNTFYQSRTAILVFCIVPLATIHFSERKLLAINLIICLLTLFLYDPIHNALGVGFYQLGYTDPDYYYTNFMYFVIFIVLIGSSGFFKMEMDTYEKQNEELIEALHSRNNLIEEQKEELTSQGEVLRQLLQEKDKDLSQVTHQLINFNHELLQYSYTVSHNLRGPVARILGLLDIYSNYSDEQEKKNVIGFIHDAARELDAITLDLNKIVENRSDTFNVRENVSFDGELNQIKQLLESPIKKYQIRILTKFNVPDIFSARQRINHILFILISNAIQYRRLDHAPEIKVSTYRKNEWIVLEIQDNGKGIDLSLYRDDLFKPFRYFHPDASGNGIGLYLAKLQAERLHGHIDVRSSPGAGTTFSVYLKDWSTKSV